MSKTFAQAPKPARPSADVIAAFERSGAGHDSQSPIPANVGKREAPKPAEPLRRLSVDLPESLHRRFKAACAKTGRKMTGEVETFIERQTRELEAQ